MEQEVDLSYIFDIIKKWLLLIILFVMLGLGAGILYGYNAPIKYESKTTLYAEPQVNSNVIGYFN